MGILDGLLGQLSEHVDVGNLAQKIGLPADQVESAIASLAKNHAAPGDTVAGAAAETGLSADKLQEIVGHIGGEGALGNFASMLGLGGEGGGLGGALGKLGGMFGGN